MRLSSIALLAGATAVAADNTVTLFLPGFDAQSIEGKVIGSVRIGFNCEKMLANLAFLERLCDQLCPELPRYRRRYRVWPPSIRIHCD